jgi:hypothetical protein
VGEIVLENTLELESRVEQATKERVKEDLKNVAQQAEEQGFASPFSEEDLERILKDENDEE